MTVYIILQAQPLEERHRKRLAAALPGHALIFGDVLPDDAARRRAAETADIVFGNLPTAWLDAAPRLRWVQLDSAGIDAYLGLAAKNRVAITNLHEFYDWAVSECTLAGILAFFRRIPELAVAQRAGAWVKDEVSVRTGRLRGAKIVILGAGAIGRRLTSLLRPFEGEVLLYARRSADAQLRDPAALDAALASADILINSLPHTPQTVGFLDRARLGRLKPGALFVNVGRGSAVDETALLEALDRGALSGAILDVTVLEPVPESHPFWRHPGVLLLQHTGGRFPGETDAKLDYFLKNFERFERGERLIGLVESARGY